MGLDIEKGLATIWAATQTRPASIDELDGQVRRWVVASIPMARECSNPGPENLPEADAQQLIHGF